MELKSKVTAVKEKPSYGHLRLSSKDFPEVKNLELGEAQTITIKVDVKGLRQPDRWEITEQKMKPTDIIAQVDIVGVSKFPEKSTNKKS